MDADCDGAFYNLDLYIKRNEVCHDPEDIITECVDGSTCYETKDSYNEETKEYEVLLEVCDYSQACATDDDCEAWIPGTRCG